MKLKLNFLKAGAAVLALAAALGLQYRFATVNYARGMQQLAGGSYAQAARTLEKVKHFRDAKLQISYANLRFEYLRGAEGDAPMVVNALGALPAGFVPADGADLKQMRAQAGENYRQWRSDQAQQYLLDSRAAVDKSTYKMVDGKTVVIFESTMNKFARQFSSADPSVSTGGGRCNYTGSLELDEDWYDLDFYDNAEDFYEDWADDFADYEEAEEYFEEHAR